MREIGMYVKREDAIRRAQSYLARAIIVNSLAVFIWPTYIFLSKHIGLHTYIALLLLAISGISLILVYYMRRALDDYSIASALKVSPIAMALGLVGGIVAVGIFVKRARDVLRTI
ncbi:MAG: hypothetical protein LM590_01650 [Thermofilum sp.]|nr:hypothetical protein [Thermofilum sp.]